MAFSKSERQQSLSALRHEPVDVAIIGGGVVGCSIAAHLGMLGLPCALFERDDIASGASGNSTGLAHAGLRYLAQGRFFYVFHESRERRRLQALAPHWVRPFEFVFPVYRSDPFGLAMVRIGTTIYDAMARFDAFLTGAPAPRPHRVLSPADVTRRIPGLRTEALQGAAEYFVDAQLQDSRFTLGLAQAAAGYGAKIVTHAPVVAISASKAGATVRVQDELSGQTFDVRARLVIHATGAWIDETLSSDQKPSREVQPSQGIHLVVDRLSEVPLIFSSPVKGRVFFVLPFGRDASLVGTTDTPHDGRADEAAPKGADVQELLQTLFRFFPDLAKIPDYAATHVRDVYWALRPLLRQSGPTLSASREHRLIKRTQVEWAVPGVKLTAARAVGAEVALEADRLLHSRNRGVVDLPPLPGGGPEPYETFSADLARTLTESGLASEVASSLVRRYGSRAAEVAAILSEEPALGDRVLPDEPWILAEAAYAAREEMVLRLNDFLWRRTKWAHYRDLPLQALEQVADVLARELGWSQERKGEELTLFAVERRRHRLPPQDASV